MPISVCPAALVAAPLEHVWRMLMTPARYGEWWDAQVVDVVPPGELAVGQTIALTSKALGRTWPVTFHVEAVHAEKHQLEIHATLPLGMTLYEHLVCNAVEATCCRIQYG